MNFDDTARYNGPTVLFPCLMCEVLMVWGPAMQVTNGRLVRSRDRNGRVFEQWNCPNCGFFYRTLIPRALPKKYQEKLADAGMESARWCADCGKVQVTGKQKYCGKCAHSRHLKAKRESAREKRRSNVDKNGNSPIAAKALTNGEIAICSSDLKTRIVEPKMSTEQPQEKGLQ
jgi:hypothetical protein